MLNLAFNALVGGTCLEDLELRRNDEVYLDALGAQRIPDPTTAGDFTRRFDQRSLLTLMECVNRVRERLWARQGKDFLLADFVFGMDARSNLKELATALAETAWKPLKPRVKYTVKTKPREGRDNVKEQVVKEREFKNVRLVSGHVAEFSIRCFFYITTREDLSAEEGVYLANGCIRPRLQPLPASSHSSRRRSGLPKSSLTLPSTPSRVVTLR